MEKHKKNNTRWDYKKIKGRLAEKGVNFSALATYCECTRQQVHTICSGGVSRYTRTRYRVQRAIAKIIGVPFFEIWGDKDDLWYGKYI